MPKQVFISIAVAFLMLNVAARFCSAADAGLKLEAAETWTPYEITAPVTSRAGEDFLVKTNSTPACNGGWQFVYSGVRPGQAYRLRTHATHKDMENAWDSLVVMVLWDRWEPAKAASGSTPWNYLLPRPAGDHAVDFENTVVAPEKATCLTIRCALRWTQRGSAQWTPPRIEAVAAPERKPVKVCVITEAQKVKDRHTKPLPLSKGLGLAPDLAESVDLWGTLALRACERKPQLIVTPEAVIRGEDKLTGRAEVPGPAMRPFEKIAREHNVYLVLGVRAREGNTFYNSCVLIGPSGKVEGIYRKVHLATSEGFGLLTPGKSFPVFDTRIGRIGCLICMDTMLPESARMLALNGADFICLPIMGDLRADRWSPGNPIFDEDLWKALMRTRAVDNQLTMVIARNGAIGSCVINRKGDFLAYNDGTQEVIEATVPASDGFRSWNGGDVRETTYMLRRPHLYDAFTEPYNLKPVLPDSK